MKLHNDKITGVVNSNNIYVTHRKPNHFFNKYNGLGLSLCILENLLYNNIKKIVFLYKAEWGQPVIILYTTPTLFKKHGIKYYYESGQEVQLILPLKYFKVIK